MKIEIYDLKPDLEDQANNAEYFNNTFLKDTQNNNTENEAVTCKSGLTASKSLNRSG